MRLRTSVLAPLALILPLLAACKSSSDFSDFVEAARTSRAVANLESDVAGLVRRYQEAQERISTYAPQVEEAESLAMELEQATREQRAANNALAAEVAKLKEQTGALTKERDALKGQVAALTEERDALKGQVGTVAKEKAATQAALTEERARRSALIAELKALTYSIPDLRRRLLALQRKTDPASEAARSLASMLELIDNLDIPPQEIRD